ncbi:MATE family efflux transporter [Parenemella sanctibonifatiensis]|uniref:MATE family efflux transporter n=1 Tax=Parenemella sanctibonifatiensis TaxID=2016505 RepID=A0A255EGT2_9ACTN|nr:MATE family efflux transporter [Parenemella sanctibonifatiensis]OYN90181.1 MATE family efflux transporter [Parenemella sanctibonifatiensis]
MAPDSSPDATADPPPVRGHRRQILALAVPALATLITEPLLLLSDTVVVGLLGTEPLAGLAIGTSVIMLVVGLSVFLAYGTTATVARQLGADRPDKALAAGLDGMALAAVIGSVVGVTLSLTAPVVVSWYNATAPVSAYAASYLRILALATPAALVMLAATGVLRGLQDTRTPLWVAIGANVANIVMNVLFVLVFGWGLPGAAIGTLISQYAAATVLTVIVIRGARRAGAQPRLDLGGILRAAKAGSWLLLRSASLQVATLTATMVATSLGTVALAAHQVTHSVWSVLVMILDALAIAAQALTGHGLGAGDVTSVRRLTAITTRWGLWVGVALLVLLIPGHLLIPLVITPDPAVAELLRGSLLVLGIVAPIGGVVFVLDGVLIGAGDARYLALAGLIAVAAYLPLSLLVGWSQAGVAWLWAAWGGYLLARAATLVLRARGENWMRLGG